MSDTGSEDSFDIPPKHLLIAVQPRQRDLSLVLLWLVLLSIQYWPLNCTEKHRAVLAKFVLFAWLNNFGNTDGIKI